MPGGPISGGPATLELASGAEPGAINGGIFASGGNTFGGGVNPLDFAIAPVASGAPGPVA